LSDDANRILTKTYPKNDELSELNKKPWWKFW
jgi:hypothetical protein